LSELEKYLESHGGEYFITKTTQENYEIARDIFKHADGAIVTTAFHDNPADYGPGDLVRSFRFGGQQIQRLTATDVCDDASVAKARGNLQEIKPGARLIVIPKDERYTRIDGIFCRCGDGTHLAFVALTDPKTGKNNEGIVFRDGFATEFFQYYQALAEKHT
jgi:hypothetical protein